MKQDFEDHRIPFTDDSQTLQRFCAKLEFLLQFGMKGECPVSYGSEIIVRDSYTKNENIKLRSNVEKLLKFLNIPQTVR